MPNELRKPVRSDYDSDSAFIEACNREWKAYHKREMQLVDAIPAKIRTERAISLTPPKPTAFDYLIAHPAMAERYKERGPACFLEL